jgi:PHP family Zn ribbon phosphoesterase
VDENEQIIEEIEFLLISALDQSIDQVEQKVHSLGGIFIPAHIDRPSYSITSQLGFIPADLNIDAIEISASCKAESVRPFITKQKDVKIIRNSDAHYVDQIGKVFTTFEMEHRSFAEVKLALHGMLGRNTSIA